MTSSRIFQPSDATVIGQAQLTLRLLARCGLSDEHSDNPDYMISEAVPLSCSYPALVLLDAAMKMADPKAGVSPNGNELHIAFTKGKFDKLPVNLVWHNLDKIQKQFNECVKCVDGEHYFIRPLAGFDFDVIQFAGLFCTEAHPGTHYYIWKSKESQSPNLMPEKEYRARLAALGLSPETLNAQPTGLMIHKETMQLIVNHLQLGARDKTQIN